MDDTSSQVLERIPGEAEMQRTALCTCQLELLLHRASTKQQRFAERSCCYMKGGDTVEK